MAESRSVEVPVRFVEVRRLDETIHLLVCAVKNLQTGLTDQQRVDLWDSIQAGHCRRCGRPGVWICQCENDE